MTDLAELKRLADPVEAEIQKVLNAIGAVYSTGEGSNGGPDFTVKNGPHIECKRFYSARAIKQMQNLDQAILVQGLDAAKWLSSTILSLIQRVREAENVRSEAIRLMTEAARSAGEWQGKYEAAGYPGTLDGWIERAKKAEAALAFVENCGTINAKSYEQGYADGLKIADADRELFATPIAILQERARNEALEEAAKVAEGHNYAIMSATALDVLAVKIAQAIRALKEKA